MTHIHVMSVGGKYFKVHEDSVSSLAYAIKEPEDDWDLSLKTLKEVSDFLKRCVDHIKEKYPDSQHIYVKSWTGDPYLFWLQPLSPSEVKEVEKLRNRASETKKRREDAARKRLIKIMKENPELTKQVAKEIDA